MNRQLCLSPMNHRDFFIPLPKQPCSTTNKVSTVLCPASPSSNCLPASSWLLRCDPALPRACKTLTISHVPLVGPDSPRWELTGGKSSPIDQTTKGQFLCSLWKQPLEGPFPTPFQAFLPQRVYFLIKTRHFLTFGTEHLRSGNPTWRCAIRA